MDYFSAHAVILFSFFGILVKLLIDFETNLKLTIVQLRDEKVISGNNGIIQTPSPYKPLMIVDSGLWLKIALTLIPFGIYFIYHVYYMHFRKFDYDYNIKINIGAGKIL